MNWGRITVIIVSIEASIESATLLPSTADNNDIIKSQIPHNHSKPSSKTSICDVTLENEA